MSNVDVQFHLFHLLLAFTLTQSLTISFKVDDLKQEVLGRIEFEHQALR